jgi:hypothetical protein
MNRVSGIYHSKCHSGERTILEGQKFPRCAYCDKDTIWIFIRPTSPSKTKPESDAAH